MKDNPLYSDIAELIPIVIPDDKAGVEAAWLRLTKLPLDKDLRGRLIEILDAIHAMVEKITQQHILYDVYLQMTQLERPSGALVISKNASRWTPGLGLGVWPDREPPQPLSKEDFFNTPPGQNIRQASFYVMSINNEEQAVRLEVINEMAGTGALLVTMMGENITPDHRTSISKRLEAYMTAETFRGYPMYFPLLDEKSLIKMRIEDFDAFLPECMVYFREDVLEKAVLIVSRIPLQKLFTVQD
ncbi:MAG TPA: hypothetical protein VHT24_05830 [Pseudacidobacterium sp.]|jgi:hypothetical protein|nr:hypothetical protein [Pseudacidobacterium sp.]